MKGEVSTGLSDTHSAEGAAGESSDYEAEVGEEFVPEPDEPGTGGFKGVGQSPSDGLGIREKGVVAGGQAAAPRKLSTRQSASVRLKEAFESAGGLTRFQMAPIILSADGSPQI